MDDQDLDLRRPTEEPLIAPPAKSPGSRSADRRTADRRDWCGRVLHISG